MEENINKNNHEDNIIQESESIEVSIHTPKKHVGIVAMALAAIIIITSIFIFKKPGSTGRDYITYYKDNQLYFTYLDKIDSFAVTEDFLLNDDALDTQVTKDHNRIFYYDGNVEKEYFTLCYRDLKKNNKKFDSATVIDTGVNPAINFKASEKGTMIAYVKGESTSLYVSDLKSREKLDSDVTEFYTDTAISRLAYLADNELYICKIGKGAKVEKEKLGKADRIIYADNNLDKIYYMRDNTIYLKEWNSDTKENLISNVEQTINYDEPINSDGTILYLKRTEETKFLSEYLTDEFEISDNFLENSPYDYDKYEEYGKKRVRNMIREDASKEIIDTSYNSLWFFDGKNSEKLADNFVTELSDINSSCMIFRTKTITKTNAIDVDEIRTKYRSLENTEDALFEYTQKTFLFKDGKVTELPINPTGGAFFNNDFSKLYYVENKDLSYIDLSGDTPGEPQSFDSDVSTAHLFKNEVYCFKCSDDNTVEKDDISKKSFDLYFNGNLIDNDVNCEGAVQYKDNLYYTTKDRTLKKFDGKKSVRIADDADQFYVYNENKIIYISFSSAEKNWLDLYLYDGKKDSVLVEEEIECMGSGSYSVGC